MCGHKYKEAQHEKPHMHCYNCNYTFYDNPRAATGVLIKQSERYLLVRRGQEPKKGSLDIPGGFVDPHEACLAGAYREVDEELGIHKTDIQIEPMPFAEGHELYVYKGKLTYVATLIYRAQLSQEFEVASIKPADDVHSYTWMKLDEIPLAEVGFAVIRNALARLRQS